MILVAQGEHTPFHSFPTCTIPVINISALFLLQIKLFKMLYEEQKFGKSPLLSLTIRLQPEKGRK